MNTVESKLARIETYRSFARLFLFEPEARELRVEFAHLFLLNVFPYASVYLDPEGFLNTETTARVQAAYEQAGFVPDPAFAIGAPDHFGVELLFLAHLLETGGEAERFLDEEILPWAGVFLHAMERNARVDFYRDAARAVRTSLFARGNAGHWTLPPVSAEEDDLDAAVIQLTSPSAAGFFLSKGDLAAIAECAGLPAAFGDRRLVLENLFRAAGEYGRVRELLAAVQDRVRCSIEDYADDAQFFPNSAGIMEQWLERAKRTREKLENMVHDAESGARANQP